MDTQQLLVVVLRACLLACLLGRVSPECMNGCSGHGKCTVNDMCVCYRNWQANDCSERVCLFGPSFVDSPKGDLDASGTIDPPDELVAVNSFTYPYGTSESYPNLYDSRGKIVTQSGHAYTECSNAGVCNRKTGECECQQGFEGAACQRLVCFGYPGYWYGYHGRISPCSGHGTCRTITSIVDGSLQDAHDSYNLWDKQLSTACECDRGFYGGDCHLRTCKKDVDPVYLDDFALVSYGRYYFSFLASDPNATLSDGASGRAYFRLRVFDNQGEGWLTSPIMYPPTCTSLTDALAALPHRLIDPAKLRCAVANVFKLDPLAHRNPWELHRSSRWKLYFDSSAGVGIQGARDFHTRVNPVFWTQFPRGYSYAANNSATDPTLTGSVFLIEFNGLVGDIPEPEIIVYSDGHRSTLVPSKGHYFTNVWTDGQRAEAIDYFSNLCPKVTVRIDSTDPNYHFVTGMTGTEKSQLMQCLGDADYDNTNNILLPGSGGKSWDYGSPLFPHIVRMVRVFTDVADSGFYVALYYDTSVTNLFDGGETLPTALMPGTFKLLHPFESLDHEDDVQYYVYTTKGTLQVAGNRSEAAFDFASKDFFVTNQTHVIDTGVYWRINETQTVELSGTDVNEVQVVQTRLTSTVDQPEVQTVTVKAQRAYAKQQMGVTVQGSDVAALISASPVCALNAKCSRVEAQFSGQVTFRFDPTQCGISTGAATAGNTVDTNFCVLAMQSLSSPNSAYSCPTATDCVSGPVTLGASLTANSIKAAICGIKGKNVGGDLGTSSFMLDNSNNCVTVSDESKVTASDTYAFSFIVTFSGNNLQGDVPLISIYSTSGTYTKSDSSKKVKVLTFSLDQLTHTSLITTGNVYRIYSGSPTRLWTAPTTLSLLPVTRGNQPDGTYKLSYTCPAKWTSVQISISPGTAKGDHVANEITTSATTLRLNHVFRIVGLNTYHRVIALDSSCTSYTSTCLSATVSPYINTKIRAFTQTIELGVFYSDPFKLDPVWSDDYKNLNPFMISEACRLNNKRWTGLITPYDSADSVKAGLLTVMNQLLLGTSSITVTRTMIDMHQSCVLGTSCYLGYVYTITFTSAHGDGLPLGTASGTGVGLGTPNLLPIPRTAAAAYTPTVTVATVQDGSMIYDGYFSLSQTFPHSYLGTPASSTANYLRWNALASEVQTLLSGIEAFGSVTVTRSAYKMTGEVRWRGGFIWTITFTSRNGKLPQMGITSSNLVAAASATAAVGTQDFPLAVDDPGTAVRGNQVGGTYGLSFTDALGNVFPATATDFKVISPTTHLPLSAAEFSTQLRAKLGNTRLTEVKVTRSATVNAVMGYTYTVEFYGKNLRGQLSNLAPSTSLLNKTASSSSSSVWVSVSETVSGQNFTRYNTQYDGQISCEASGSSNGACLSKGDLFFVLDPYTPKFNPPYLNMHRAVSVYTREEVPFTPGLHSMYPHETMTEKERLWTFKRYVVQSDLSSNWAQDPTGQASFRFFKFSPHPDSTFQVVAECANRGTCDTFEGVCDCFHSYSGDACTNIEAMAI